MIGVGVRDTPREPPRGRSRSGSRASERDHWLALSQVPGIGPAGFAQLLRHHGSASAAWSAGPDGLRAVSRLSPDAEAGFHRLRGTEPRELAGRRCSGNSHCGQQHRQCYQRCSKRLCLHA